MVKVKPVPRYEMSVPELLYHASKTLCGGGHWYRISTGLRRRRIPVLMNCVVPLALKQTRYNPSPSVPPGSSIRCLSTGDRIGSA
eukprot:3543032-Rhodomonas_salina.5